ncbi:MAG: homocysteine S-methyltransferase family protein [Clostridia bacterium]|nr:homocysteine S-methyltransferase family protein [Clostridia bacterium]
MKNILEILGKKRLYFDGATGTELEKLGLLSGETPEQMNLRAPEAVEALHRAYFEAGADVIKTNTFGANSLKHENYAEMIEAALGCASRARAGREDKFIAFDIGPTGKMLEPLGDLSFEGAVEIFAKSIRAAEGKGADLILIETMSDTYETKAAVIAAKENSSLPIFVTNVYDAGGKMLTGASPEVSAALLEGLGVSAFGMNCSLGPDKMAEILPRLADASSVPIIVNPNAGLPEVRDGVLSFTFSEEEFCAYMKEMAPYCAVMGGCCGTTPEYIRALRAATEGIPLLEKEEKGHTRVTSFAKIAEIGGSTVIIGERLNPTGKKKLKEALVGGNISYILEEAIKQQDAGAHVLDVNVGLPEIDEVEKMREVISAVQSVSDLPLQIDTADPSALAAAMRIYNGKPLVNSVNGSRESMDAVFPLVKKYGGTVIALTLDESGIPADADGRLKIAHRIIKEAGKYGISRKDIIVDPLALAISAQADSATVTLDTVRALAKEGIHTSLGVSNISFGLPRREIINSAFFAAALTAGLNAAIINPMSEAMMNVYFANEALTARDPSCEAYVAYAASLPEEDTHKGAPKSEKKSTAEDDPTNLFGAIVKGLRSSAGELAESLLKTEEPLAVINGYIIPALDEVGGRFERSEIYLPALLASAEAAREAFEAVKKRIPEEKSEAGALVLATVEGDMHDIGKNIVKVILESHGFRVYDLGRNVPAEKILDKVKETGARLVGLSALMTTTVPAMEKTIKLLREKAPFVKVTVGGAVMNPDYAKMIGADFYSADAMGALEVCKSFFGK